MYRVLAVIGGALTLAGCASSDFGNLDVFKSGPMMDTVRLESEPPGADAKASNGQSCKTPCALALPVDQPMTVTFSLPGYETQTEQLEVVNVAGSPPALRPNPIVAELTAGSGKPAAKKPARKPAAKKPAAKKPAAKPAAAKPAAAPAAAVAPAPSAQAPTFAPPPPASSSPWPAPPPPQR